MANVIDRPSNSPRARNKATESRLELSIAQADAGELVNWDAAEKWIESWGTEAEISRPEPENG